MSRLSPSQPSPSQPSPSQQQWNDHREIIIELWSERNMTLEDVIVAMHGYGFHATSRMYKAQLKSWGVGKNATEDDWLAWAKILQAGTPGTTPQIKIHNKIRRLPDLRKWLRDHKMDEKSFLSRAKDWGGPIPSHVRLCAVDPVGEEQQHPADGGENPEHIPPLDPFTFQGVFEADQGMSISFSSQHRSPGILLPLVDHDPGRRPSYPSDPMDIESTYGPHSDPQTFPEFPRSAVGDQDAANQIRSDCTSSLGSSSAQMRQDTPHDIRSEYIGACEYAALKGHIGLFTEMKHWIVTASSYFRQLCQNREKEVLVVASVVLTWLKMHVNSEVAQSVMMTALSPAQQHFGPEHPLATTIEWMTLMTYPERLSASHLTASIMRCIWADFSKRLGDHHPHTMVALYNYCFHLMLVEKGYLEAQVHLTALIENTIEVHGAGHVFTINVLATLARAQRRLKQLGLALQTIGRAVAHTPLGRNHPHHLELLFRKAITLRKLGRDIEAEELYWLVARGRIATLGWKHEKTQSAHQSLVEVLKANGTWDLRKNEAHQILTDPQIAVVNYESWWKDTSEAAGRSKRAEQSSSEESDGPY